MALKQGTFKELYELTFALIGRNYLTTVTNNAFDSSQFARLVSLFNQGAIQAYRASNYWERYIVTGQPRTLTSDLFEESEDSFHVRGAGTTEANGLYVRNGSYTNKAKYTLFQSDGTTELYHLRHHSNNNWEIVTASGTQLYTQSGTGSHPVEAGWVTQSAGTSPAPLSTDVSNIDTVLRVHKQEPYSGSTATELEFFSQGDRYKVMSAGSGDEVYVTYKKEYTPGFGVTTADGDEVPAEFLPYIAHYTAYTWQRSVEQNASENNFALSLGIINQVLENELAKIDDQNVFNTIGKKFKTYRNTSTLI
jgi:hypothetical protein